MNTNPRFDPVDDQQTALHAICTYQGLKLVELAEDIVHSGLSTTDLPMVLEVDGLSRYTVVEGIGVAIFLIVQDVILETRRRQESHHL
jgi:hypothetical protein